VKRAAISRLGIQTEADASEDAVTGRI